MDFFKRIVFILLGIAYLNLLPTTLFGQSSGFNLDSFYNSVQKLSTDTAKIRFMVERATSLACEDSASKLSLAMEAKKMAEKNNWPAGIYFTNRLLGDINIYCLRNYQKVFEIFQESADLAKKKGDVVNQAMAYEAMAKNYARINQHDKSIEYFGKALTLGPGFDLEIGIMAEIGFAYGSINDYLNAITYYDSCRKLIELSALKKKSSDLSDTLVLVGILINMADIYLAMPNTAKALGNYQKVLQISRGIENKRFVILSLTGIGRTYKQQKEYSKAIDYFQMALIESHMINQFADEVVVLNEISKTYLDAGDYVKAQGYADTSLSLAEGQHFQSLLSMANATLGNVYLKQNRTDLAIFYLQKALDFSIQNHKINDQKEALNGLSIAFQRAGQYEKALNALQRFINLKDSIKNIEKSNEAIAKDIDNNYQREKMLQYAEYTKRIERVKWFTYGGYGGLGLVILLAFFIYRNYNIQKKYNALLSKEKKSHLAHIEAQSHALSDIAHIQAHEVRGPVSAILGFVQIFNYEDPADPNNAQVMEWIGVTANKLDTVVRNVVSKENEVRHKHKNHEDS